MIAQSPLTSSQYGCVETTAAVGYGFSHRFRVYYMADNVTFEDIWVLLLKLSILIRWETAVLPTKQVVQIFVKNA